ncbi:hypothetical protein HY993_04440 [Candidatus Micrarchaeota archaeon]|nr:hypothetical protein [Candidatus Micrarchaeota archaeon]
MQRKGQGSIEYLSVVLLMLLALLPIIYYSFQQVNSQSAIQQAELAVYKLSSAADAAYVQGVGTQIPVTITIPDGVNLSASYITANEINLAVYTQNSRTTSVFRTTLSNVSGYFTTNPGTYVFVVSSTPSGVTVAPLASNISATPTPGVPLILFAPPTPANQTVFSAQDYVEVNISSNESLSSAQLVWNGVAENMAPINSTNFFLNKTGLANGNYTYAAYGYGILTGYSQTRLITIAAIPTPTPTPTPTPGPGGPLLTFISSTPANASSVASPYVFANLSSNESLSSATLEFDGVNSSMASFNSTVYYFNKTGLSDGLHSFKAYGTALVTGVSQTQFVTTDTAPPVLSNLLPTGILNNRSAILHAVTDENATCKYDTTDLAYGLMGNLFSLTGATVHNQTIFSPRGSYAYYVRCSDSLGNKNNASQTISFIVEPIFLLFYPSLGWDYYSGTGIAISPITPLNAIDGTRYTISANIPKQASAFDDTKNISFNFSAGLGLTYFVDQVWFLQNYRISAASVTGFSKLMFRTPSRSYSNFAALPTAANTDVNQSLNVTFPLSLHDPNDVNKIQLGITAYTSDNKNAKTSHDMIRFNVSYYTG